MEQHEPEQREWPMLFCLENVTIVLLSCLLYACALSEIAVVACLLYSHVQVVFLRLCSWC